MEKKKLFATMKRLVGPSIHAGWFTPEEMATLVATSYKYDIGVFIRLAFYAGLSIDEIKGLHWDSLHYYADSDDEYCELCISEVRYDNPLPLCGSPNCVRTGCYRKLLLPIKTGRELVQWCELHTIRNTPYMLVEENGDLMEWYILSRKYSQVINVAHVRQLGYDSLRNTFVFNALNAGLSVDVIALILGLKPSYELSEAESAQIEQKFAYGFPESQNDVFATVDYMSIDPEMEYIHAKNMRYIREQIKWRYGF